MNSDALIEFEENGYDTLVEEFIQKNRDMWEEFVMERYESHCADMIDHAKDRSE